jgi:hypothetical protein
MNNNAWRKMRSNDLPEVNPIQYKKCQHNGSRHEHAKNRCNTSFIHRPRPAFSSSSRAVVILFKLRHPRVIVITIGVAVVVQHTFRYVFTVRSGIDVVGKANFCPLSRRGRPERSHFLFLFESSLFEIGVEFFSSVDFK